MRNYKEEYKKRKEKYVEVRAYLENELAFKLKEKLKKNNKTISGWISENAESYINNE